MAAIRRSRAERRGMAPGNAAEPRRIDSGIRSGAMVGIRGSGGDMMVEERGFAPLEAAFRDGSEPLTSDGKPLRSTILGFWRWSESDLADNATRGVLAEYLVALALGCETEPRRSWDTFDLVSPEGVKVEIKSASPWQSWYQERPSALSFRIPPTHGWSEDTGKFAPDARRHADAYVFAILASTRKADLNPLDLGQWTFHVLPTRVLDERIPAQKSIALSRLRELGAVECCFEELGRVIEDCRRSPEV